MFCITNETSQKCQSLKSSTFKILTKFYQFWDKYPEAHIKYFFSALYNINLILYILLQGTKDQP